MSADSTLQPGEHQKRRVLVLGGYGLIGLEVVRALVAAGHTVTGLGRGVGRARRVLPEVRWFACDLARVRQPGDWTGLISDADAIVNCAGALQDGLKDDVRAVQLLAMAALFAECERQGGRMIIQVSAVGAVRDAGTPFMQTKAEADAKLMASSLAWVVLRPGLVIAPVAYGASGLLRALASMPLAVPVLGGNQVIQTVSVHDVARTVQEAVEGRLPLRSVYDLVERQPNTLAEVLLAVRAWLGLEAAPVIRCPALIGRLAVAVGDALGWLGWRCPLRSTALAEINRGIRGDPAALVAAGQPEPKPLAATLATMPAGVQQLWFARLWLLKPVVFGTLSLFWISTGLVALARADASCRLLQDRGFTAGAAWFLVTTGSLLDVALGACLIVRPLSRLAALAMVAVTLAYLGAGTVLAPALWLDPLGPYLKTLPGLVLALVALAILEER